MCISLRPTGIFLVFRRERIGVACVTLARALGERYAAGQRARRVRMTERR